MEEWGRGWRGGGGDGGVGEGMEGWGRGWRRVSEAEERHKELATHLVLYLGLFRLLCPIHPGQSLADVSKDVALYEEGVVLGLEGEAPTLHSHLLYCRPHRKLEGGGRGMDRHQLE